MRDKKNNDKENVSLPLVPEPAENRLAALNEAITRWFYQPDLQAIRVTMGTVQSHYLGTGDPAWLFTIAPPSTGKTSLAIMGTAQLPQVVSLGGFTPNTFLSGYYGKKEPGLLEKLGETVERNRVFTTTGDAILLCKDFTTVLSMRREGRGEILSQLREIHDGEFRRTFGTGETKVWRGRITMIAAVTPVIDRHYAIFSTLGERFLQVRWHRPGSPKAGQRAIRQQGAEQTIREELQSAVKDVFDRAVQSPPKLNAKAEKRLANAAELVAIARTHIFRINYGNRDIDYTPEPEGNTRISKGLASIAKGVAALNGRRKVEEQDLQDAFRVALDSISDNRRLLLLSIFQGNSRSVSLARTVMTREIEELEALKLITSTKAGPQLTKQASKLFQTAGIVINNDEQPSSNRRTPNNPLLQ